MMTKTAAVVLFFSLIVTFTSSVQGQQAGVASPPPLLTYNELVSLYETDPPSTDLSTKLGQLLTTPFVNNSTGVRAPRMIKASLSQGGTLRVATWNIERGLEFDALKAALTERSAILSPAARDDAQARDSTSPTFSSKSKR